MPLPIKRPNIPATLPNKKAKTGLKMDGTQYVQLPSMTMDSIEIDCLIDSDGTSIWKYLVDAREGYSGYYAFTLSEQIKDFTVEGFIPKTRTTIKLKANTTFTDDITIFASRNGRDFLKGTLYGVKCYLNGQVVAEYDFTNPNNIVGDKLIQNAKNLIPSFEDEAWNLHSNFKVFGPNVGRLDATANQQFTVVNVDVKPNTKYKVLVSSSQNGRTRIGKHDGSDIGIYLTHIFGSGSFEITTDSSTSKIVFAVDNYTASGSFDFIKPMLIELTGKEAQLFGSPTPQVKAPKRLLYAKR